MQADFETIKKITAGAVRIRQTERGIAFDRCTEAELAAWYARRPVLGDRARTGGGVRLDFHTDARSITFSLSGGNKVDVWIDGTLRRQCFFNDLREQGTPDVTAPLEAAPAESRVTLWLSAHSGVTLDYLRADGATYLRPHTYRHRLLFLGDSITHGWNAAHDSLAYVPRVARYFDANYINSAVGGGCFFPETVDKLDYDPEAIVVAFGTNDFVHWPTPEALHENCAAYMDRVRELYPNKPVFAITPLYRVEQAPHNAGTFDECRATVAAEATRCGFTVVDGYTLMRPLEENYAGDGLHPCETGFGEIAENLIPVMQKALGW